MNTLQLKNLLIILLFSLIISACSGGGNDSSEPQNPQQPNPPPPTNPFLPSFHDTVAFFEDVASSANLDFRVSVGQSFDSLSGNSQLFQLNFGNGAAVGDIDNDGDLDVYLLAQSGFDNALFQNNWDNGSGSKTFTDITPQELKDNAGMSRVAHFVDLDDNGFLDLILINDQEGLSQSKIFENNGDRTFTDVTQTAGSQFNPTGYFRMGCAVADYDLDGRLDIYVTNWSQAGMSIRPALPGENKLYRNMGNFVFEDVTNAVNLSNIKIDSFSAIFKDFNDDDYPDIYTAVDHREDLFHVNNSGVFSDQTNSVGTTHTGNDMGVAAADWDDDGDIDLYMTNITDRSGRFGTTQFNGFYINQFSQTGNLTFINQVEDFFVENTFWGWGTDFIDVENDGDLDLIVVTGFDNYIVERVGIDSPIYTTPSVFFRNDSGTLNRVSSTGLDMEDDSRALIVFDYDRDGDEDLLITNIGQPVRLLENISPNQGNWWHLKLKPDSKAIGATVFAEINGVTKRRDIIVGKSYLAGTPSEIHFGLGSATQIDSLTIRWADGVEELITDPLVLQANQIIEREY